MLNYLAVNIGDSFFGSVGFLKTLGGVSTLVGLLVSNIIMLLGVVLIFIIVYAGLQMVSGSGDPAHFERAKNTLTAGIIGFVIAVAAWFIVRIIEQSTGTSILK